MNYLIIANIYLTLFGVFYWLFLSKETFFQINRWYLIGTVLLSFVLPLIQLTWLQEMFRTSTVVIARASIDAVAVYAEPKAEEEFRSFLSKIPFWLTVYMAGCAVQAFFTIRKVIALKRKLGMDNSGDAYSFLGSVKVDRDQDGASFVLQHEKVHVRQLHSLDILFAEAVKIFNWFNPMVYYWSKSVKLTHEYIADEAINKTAQERLAYAELLISKTFSIAPSALTNNFFNHSFIKSRIHMLFKNKSKRTALLKYTLAVPLFVGMLIFSSAKVSDVEGLSRVLSDNLQVKKSFYKSMGRNINYLQEAKENGAIGAVDIAFESEKGEVKQAKALKTIGFGIEKEVIRVLSLPEVQPDLPEGKHILRVNFKMMPVEEDRSRKEETKEDASRLEGYHNLDDLVIVGYAKQEASPKGRPEKENDTERVQLAINREDQDTVKSKEDVSDYNLVDVPPSFPGGMKAFYEWVGQNYVYPQKAKDEGVNGTIHLSFVVERNGALSDFKLLQDLGHGTGEAALEMLKKSPKWTPATVKGEAVRVAYSLPIQLNLQEKE
ncbi:energy transducer TonB [Olivibacter sp. SDN3]|uniref:energy transducer TonB n=1 Tax=Olivibacter sp. SDN3 TaxID=2764720 RepID=UPI001650E2D4|nr:energy transducer TonB [Olivibacter sp. SDN3]QNL51212.1 energy transducer TonB [Olivibacter sp. SDN3]